MAISAGSGVAIFSFTLKQGADLTISMTWLDDNGLPMDLTGYVMALSIIGFGIFTNPLLTLLSTSSTGSRIVLGGTAGTIDLVFSRVDTGAFVAGSLRVYQMGLYDLKYTDPAGEVGYLLEGTVSLDPKVTL